MALASIEYVERIDKKSAYVSLERLLSLADEIAPQAIWCHPSGAKDPFGREVSASSLST
jgi:hypothetical protein